MYFYCFVNLFNQDLVFLCKCMNVSTEPSFNRFNLIKYLRLNEKLVSLNSPSLYKYLKLQWLKLEYLNALLFSWLSRKFNRKFKFINCMCFNNRCNFKILETTVNRFKVKLSLWFIVDLVDYWFSLFEWVRFMLNRTFPRRKPCDTNIPTIHQIIKFKLH